jgi:hypothetical protein
VRRADAPSKLEARRLDELPPGNLILAVMREVDGCVEPVIVRYGYGLGSGAPPSRAKGKIYR